MLIDKLLSEGVVQTTHRERNLAMLKIRPFEPIQVDYAATVAVKNAIFGDEPVTVKQLMYEDASWKAGYLFERLMLEVDGKVAAVACYFENFWQYQPGKYDVELLVHPAYQGQGIGTILYNHIIFVLENREPKAISLVSSTRENQPRALRFLERHGFTPVMRWARSRLDLSEFTSAKSEAVADQMQRQGIKIYSLKELQTTCPDWQQRYYELDRAAGQDAPSPDPMSENPFEQFVAQTFGHPYFTAETHFIAVDDGGQWLGLIELGDRENPQHLITPFTCVHPSHRRRGITMALKLQAIEFARRHGAKTITAVNEEHKPMYQINLALGFKLLPAALTMKKMI